MQFGPFFGTLRLHQAFPVRTIRSILLLCGLLGAGTSSAPAQAAPDTGLILIRPELTGEVPRVPGFFPRHLVKRPRVGLVLSGGGSRGIAAIGVLRALEERNIPVDLIVGTSIGSIVGGLYACGYSTWDLQRLVDTTKWEEILSLNDEARRRDMFYDQKLARDKSLLVLRFNGLEPVIPQAFSSGRRLTNYLNILTLQGLYHPDPSFDHLRVPFRAVATDLISGKKVVIDRGDLAEALRASMAIPLLFSAVARDTAELLDGGLVANLPVDVARQAGADFVIAADMTSPLRPRGRLEAPWEIADQITAIMMQETNRIARSRSDAVIEPVLRDHLSSDFAGLDTLILRGYEAASAAIPAVAETLRVRATRMYSAAGDRTFPGPRWHLLSPDTLFERLRSVRTWSGRDRVRESDLRLFAADLMATGAYDDVVFRVRPSGTATEIEAVLQRFPMIRSVEISGAHVVQAETLRALLNPLLGSPLNVLDGERRIEAVLGCYRDRGYSLARIREVRYDSTRGSALIVIDEGVITLSTILPTAKTRDWVIRRELPWSVGEVFDVHNAAQAIANLNGTGLFDQTLIAVHHEGVDGQTNVVTTAVRERSTELIRLGLRADNERNIQSSIDVRDENFLGAGAVIGLTTGFGPRNQFLAGELKDSRIFDTYLTVGIRGYVTVQDVNLYSDGPEVSTSRFYRERVGEYRQRQIGGVFSFGTQLERIGSVTVAQRIEKQIVRNIYQTPVKEDDLLVSAFRLGMNIDTQDKFPYPNDGVLIDASYEWPLIPLSGSHGFTKFAFSYERYRTYGELHTLHPRFVLGVGDETMPLAEQFSLGGQTNFFGVPEENARGRQMLLGSLEYRYRIPWRFVFDTFVKARYDLGAIWLKPEEVRLEDLQHGIGISFGFDTPVGPAEFALGRSFYLRKDLLGRPATWGPVTFYFSIGYPIMTSLERR